MMNFLTRVSECEVMVYLSTSGVYGDCNGRWVYETDSPNPKNMRSIRRYDAECQLQDWSCRHDVRIVILRVPGIYAVDRLPRARLERGDPVLDPKESGWSNRIHAEDLADAIVLAIENGAGVYNVSDGNPSSMSEFFLACARHLGLPAPPTLSRSQAKQIFSPQLWSYMEESRRLNIDKARRELQFHPKFPTLEDAFSSR